MRHCKCSWVVIAAWLLLALLLGSGEASAQQQQQSQQPKLNATSTVTTSAAASNETSPETTKCPPLTASEHLTITYSNSTNTGGVIIPLIASFKCTLGRTVDGATSSKCLRSGRWTHKVPKCIKVGLRVYESRSPSGGGAIAALSGRAPEIIAALSQSVSRDVEAMGFQVRNKGVQKAYILKRTVDVDSLVPSADHDVYLYNEQGVLRHHRGFAAPTNGRLRAVEWSTDSIVLAALRASVAERRLKDSNIVGFGLRHGRIFDGLLLGWHSFPFRTSKKMHSFILQHDVEEAIVEKGCFKAGNTTGQAPLRSESPMPKGIEMHRARMVCAALARNKNHRYFALSHDAKTCHSGRGNFDRYGSTTSLKERLESCAVTAAFAQELQQANSSWAQIAKVGASALKKGYFHTFEIWRALLPHQIIRNGGFEEDDYLVPRLNAATNNSLVKSSGSSSKGGRGKQHMQLGAVNGWYLSQWELSKNGHVGLATHGSPFLAHGQPIPDGQYVLYLKNGGSSISQTLYGLEVGARYTLRFHETFRRDWAPGMGLRVRLGDSHVIYQNSYISVPLWSHRAVHFRATATSMKLSFIATDAQVARLSPHSKLRRDAAILLDAVSVSQSGFSVVKDGFAGAKGAGRIAKIDASHPMLVKAFAEVVKAKAEAGNGGIGFRIEKNVVASFSNKHVSQALKPSKGSVVVFNNGTVVKDHTTHGFAAHLSMKEPSIVDAVAKIAQKVANSIGFTLNNDMHDGVQIHVLADTALPLEKAEGFTTFLFDDHITDLGCWAAPSNDVPLFPTVHPIRTGAVTKSSCARAAREEGHDYFAMQTIDGHARCLSGSNDKQDPEAKLFYAHGHSSGCNQRCHGTSDVCGGVGAASVYRLPLYTHVSRNGQASTDRVRVSHEALERAQLVFDEPGKVLFTTVDEKDLIRLRSVAKVAESGAANPEALVDAVVPPPAAPAKNWSHPLLYHFAGAQQYAVAKYSIQAPTLASDHPLTPSSWTFEGSNDGLTWTVLDKQEHTAFYTGHVRSFYLRNARSFHFHRFVFTENSGAEVAGVGLQGVQLFSRSGKVRFLRALYRFEDTKQVGWDSSYGNNDLNVYAVSDAARVDPTSFFGVTNNPWEIAVQSGSLRVSNPRATMPQFLSTDRSLRVPRGVPVSDGSFGVAFWFKVNSSEGTDRWNATSPAERPSSFGIMSWGKVDGRKPLNNLIALNDDFTQILNGFNGPHGSMLATPAPPKGASLEDHWHHYAVSYNQMTGSHRVWLDRQLVASRIYDNPRFHVEAQNFLLGVSRLGGLLHSDEFQGLLDDIAIFDGPLTTEVVAQLSRGQFDEYLPRSCQRLADEFQIEAGMTWGSANEAIKESYMRQRCFTKPTDCQTLSDQYGMSPISSGKAGYYARKQYELQKCASWPSILVKANTFAECPSNATMTRQGITSQESAQAICTNLGDSCRAFVWGGEFGDAKSGMRPFELRLCSVFLSNLRYAKGALISTRVSKYLLHADSQLKCDHHDLPSHTNVPSSIHARWLCDSTPGCVAYVWTGHQGKHLSEVKTIAKVRSKEVPTPNKLILCSSTHKGKIVSLPGSGYEVGEKLRSYVALADRYAPCSPVSALAIINGTHSSMAARRECDRLDGYNGSPMCMSYVWDREKGETRLCSSVPQRAVIFAPGIEVGLVAPKDCQEISDAYDVSWGEGWGVAPFEIKSLFHERQCETRPQSCQQLSDTYGLSPNVTAEIAAKVPGIIRDLWLRQHCLSYPWLSESHYLISESFKDLQRQIDGLDRKIERLEKDVKESKTASLIPASQRDQLLADLHKARDVLQQQLEVAYAKQVSELEPVLQRAAASKPTRHQTEIIHDIATGLIKSTLRAVGAEDE